jgi:molecular chaperone GrpE
MIHSSKSHAVGKSREQEYLAGWKRARAELLNYRQRAGQEAEQTRERLKSDVVASMMAIADNMYALIQHLPEHLRKDPWAQGVTHVARQFDQTLKDYGVTMIDQAGVPFNPKEHEAVGESADSAHASGQVIAVTSRGYKVGERVVRPAKVVVAK